MLPWGTGAGKAMLPVSVGRAVPGVVAMLPWGTGAGKAMLPVSVGVRGRVVVVAMLPCGTGAGNAALPALLAAFADGAGLAGTCAKAGGGGQCKHGGRGEDTRVHCRSPCWE